MSVTTYIIVHADNGSVVNVGGGEAFVEDDDLDFDGDDELTDVDVERIFDEWANDADLVPMSDGQRQILFAEFNEAFGRDKTREDRHDFTRTVLGTDANVSWARHGGLTARDANRLIDVLRVVNDLL